MDPPPVMISVTIATGASVPVFGEALRLRLPLPLGGPGSLLNPTAPTGATRYNYHTAFVQSISRTPTAIVLGVLPAPSFSHPDDQGLSSATWLLRQTPSFQDRHLPLPYAELETNQPHPATPTPAAFGEPLDVGGWRDRRPSWIDIDGMKVELRRTTRFKRFNPAVVLPADEIMRIAEYAEYYYQTYPTAATATNPAERDGDRDGIALSTVTSGTLGNPATGSTPPTASGERTHHTSGAAGKQQHILRLWEYDDDDDGTEDDDDDDDGGDDVDWVGHAQLFRPDDPYLAELVKARRENEHRRLVDSVMSWAAGIRV